MLRGHLSENVWTRRSWICPFAKSRQEIPWFLRALCARSSGEPPVPQEGRRLQPLFKTAGVPGTVAGSLCKVGVGVNQCGPEVRVELRSTDSRGGCPHTNSLIPDLAGGLFCGRGWDCGFGVGTGASLVAGQVQVGAERVEDHHWEFGAEAVEFVFAPVTVEARGAGDVLREGLAVVAFTDEDVAVQASGVDVVDAPAGLAAGICETEEYFPISSELRSEE